MQLDRQQTVYLMGIGGIAMGTLATMLMKKGIRVVGSDQNLYPPMSDHLAHLKIPVHIGFDARNVRDAHADLVIIGNVIRRENPEARYVMESSIPFLSMSEAIARFFLCDHRSIVIAGTHGKSTTSALLTWLLDHAGLDPSAFIGAFLKNWGESHRLGSGPYMVVEGDEYDTAFFDKGPKFLHYRPYIGVLTSVEFDHADIYKDLDAIRKAFSQYVQLIPEDGTLIVNIDDPECARLKELCKGRVLGYGCAPEASFRLLDVAHEPGCAVVTFLDPMTQEPQTLRSPLPGKHNALNLLAVTAVCRLAGMDYAALQSGLERFKGVKRRQDVVGQASGIVVMDDFAHHPTAVKETIQAVKLFHPSGRLVAAFEPRTNSSRRRVFHDAYTQAFDDADVICIKEPPGLDAIPEPERLDTRQLVEDIASRGKKIHYFSNTESLIDFLLQEGHRGDVILCMSNGSFDGLPRRLLNALESMSG